MAGGGVVTRDQALGRGGERRHVRLSGAAPRARADSPPVDGAVGLSEVRGAIQEGRPLLLLQELGTAEPGRPVHSRLIERRASGAARSEHAVSRRNWGAFGFGLL